MNPLKTKKNCNKTKKKIIVRRKQYTEENLRKALEAVKHGMPKKQASKSFNVPRGTIQSRLRKDCKDLPGPPPVLNEDEEGSLVKWVEDCSRKGFPRRKIDLQISVGNFIKKAGRKNPFKNDIPGNKWYTLFMRRHPEISERTPEAVTSASSAVSESDIKGWFKKIETFLKENSYYDILEDPSRVFNGDESNFQLCPKSGKVIALRGEKDVYEVDHAAAKSTLTVLFTFGANGDVTPPLVIFPNKRLPKDITLTVPDDWGIGLSDSGWMKTELFYDYIKNVFYPYLLRTGRKFPIILFVDGHKTHLSLEVSELCKSLDIVLIALYPNATRLLQPADVSAFRPLKVAWKESVLQWRRDHPLETLTKNNFVPVLKEALEKGIKPSTVINGFRATGLWPWNADAINYKKCLGKGSQDITTNNESHLQSTRDPSNIMTKDVFHKFITKEKMIELQNSTSVDNLSENDKILKEICMFFKGNKFDDTKVTDCQDHPDSEKTTKEDKQSKNYINIDDLPLLVLDNDIPIGDHIEVCNEIVDEAITLTGDQLENYSEIVDETNQFETENGRQKSFNKNLVTIELKKSIPHQIENETEVNMASRLGDNAENSVEIPSTPVKIQDVLIKPKTPERKGKRQVERSSFVLTSGEWQKKEKEKYRAKKIKEEEVENRKKAKLEKQEQKKNIPKAKKTNSKKKSTEITQNQTTALPLLPVENLSKANNNNIKKKSTEITQNHTTALPLLPVDYLTQDSDSDDSAKNTMIVKVDIHRTSPIKRKRETATERSEGNINNDEPIGELKKSKIASTSTIPESKRITILSDLKINTPQKKPSKVQDDDVLNRIIKNPNKKTHYTVAELEKILNEE